MNKEKFVVEYDFKKVSPSLLWTFVSTAAGLSEWFADRVENHEKEFTFHWGKSQQVAMMVASRSTAYVRFHWLDDVNERTFFEMRIDSSELTGSTMLTVTDFAEPDERDEARELWDNEVEQLRRRLGI